MFTRKCLNFSAPYVFSFVTSLSKNNISVLKPNTSALSSWLSSDKRLALELASQQKCNLVLTDVNMANMDGITLTWELRKLEDYKSTPILILTTESSADIRNEGKVAGVSGWIVKPFQPDKLLESINKVIAQ